MSSMCRLRSQRGLEVIDEAASAETFDALGERADGDGIARHGDRHGTDGLLAVVMKAHRRAQHAVGEPRIAGEPLRDEVRGALGMSYLVGGDVAEQLNEHRLVRTLGETPKEIGGEV